MSLSAFLAQGQAAAAELMEDACRIERLGESTVAEDGTDTAATTMVYEGPCRLKAAPAVATTESTGPARVETWQYTVSVPVTATGIRANDGLVVTAAADPAAVGLRLRVRQVPTGTHITARRLGCEEVSR